MSKALANIPTPRLYDWCDTITEYLIYAMVIFSPWAFGTVEDRDIWIMNAAGYCLGALLAAKWILRWRTGYQPYRWGHGPDADPKRVRRSRILTRILAGLTLFLLAYILCQILNARANYLWGEGRFDYFDHYIPWLPHSYDRDSTLFEFWKYLALAIDFWAIRDWLITKTKRERRLLGVRSKEIVARSQEIGDRSEEIGDRSEEQSSAIRGQSSVGRGHELGARSQELGDRDQSSAVSSQWSGIGEGESQLTNDQSETHSALGTSNSASDSPPHSKLDYSHPSPPTTHSALRTPHSPLEILPQRLNRLLWVICINGGLLALEAILQRLSGTNKLLWLVVPWKNNTNISQFGPWAYRSNAAQYFNLVWPLGMAFFLTLFPLNGRKGMFKAISKSGKEILIIPAVLLMMVAPFVSASRGAMAISIGLLVVILVLTSFVKRSFNSSIYILTTLILIGGGAFILGKKYVINRFNNVSGFYKLAQNSIKELTIDIKIQMPAERPPNNYYFATLTSSRYIIHIDHALVCFLTAGGDLIVRLYGENKEVFIEEIARKFFFQAADKRINLRIRKGDELEIQMDGKALDLEERKQGEGANWAETVSGPYFMVCQNNNESDKIPEILSVTLYNKASDLYGDEDLIFTKSSSWQNVYKLIIGRNSRTEIYQIASAIARDYSMLGIGAKAFPSVYQLYKEFDTQNWAALAHDDYLEFRIALGWIGFIPVLLALISIVLRSGIYYRNNYSNLIFYGCMLAIIGLLTHARFDFPMQVYSVSFAVILICVMLQSR